MVARIESNAAGPRLWILGVRLHHFHLGLALVALGLELIREDRRDMAYIISELGHSVREALRVFAWNARWELGYRIGGFTSARRARR